MGERAAYYHCKWRCGWKIDTDDLQAFAKLEAHAEGNHFEEFIEARQRGNAEYWADPETLEE